MLQAHVYDSPTGVQAPVELASLGHGELAHAASKDHKQTLSEGSNCLQSKHGRCRRQHATAILLQMHTLCLGADTTAD